MESILKAVDVSYTYMTKYQKVQALNNVNCNFYKGKFHAIIGPSGSGKSTLLLLLAGLDIPTSGDILFNDISTKEINRGKYRRSSSSVIYQAFNLFPKLNALENVMYTMELNKKSRHEANEKAKEHLLSVGLATKIYKQFPKMMSGGEQQRVAIARALASDAEIILADEPTGNLDTENSKIVIDILKRLAYEENKCVIIITHDNDIAESAEIKYKIVDGRILEN